MPEVIFIDRSRLCGFPVVTLCDKSLLKSSEYVLSCSALRPMTFPPTKKPSPLCWYERSALTLPAVCSMKVPMPVTMPANPSLRFFVCMMITDVTDAPYFTLGLVIMSTLFMFSGNNLFSSPESLSFLLLMYIKGAPLPSTDMPCDEASIIGIILIASSAEPRLARGLPSISTVSPSAFVLTKFLAAVTVTSFSSFALCMSLSGARSGSREYMAA